MSLNTLLAGVSPAAFTSMVGGFHPMLRGPSVPSAPDGSAGGALSMAEGVSLLADLPESDEAEAGDEAAADEGSQDEADDQAADEEAAPETEEDPASDELDEDEDDASAEPTSEAPKFWSAEEKALFAKAPPELQQVIAARDAEYSRQVSLAKEDAAKARADASVIGDVRGELDKLIAQAGDVFKGKWEGVDWVAWARSNPNEAMAAKMEFDAEQELLGKLRTAHAATEAEEHRQFLSAEAVKLKDMVPELADPKEGSARKTELVGYLKDNGFTPEDLKWAGAAELAVAYKAMLWDRTKAKLSRKPDPNPAPLGKAPGSAKPTAAAPPRKSNLQRRKVEAVGRVMKTGRMDDGVAALLALGE